MKYISNNITDTSLINLPGFFSRGLHSNFFYLWFLGLLLCLHREQTFLKKTWTHPMFTSDVWWQASFVRNNPGLLFATCTLSQPVTVKIKLRTLLSTEINSLMLPRVRLLPLGCAFLYRPLRTARRRGSGAVCAGCEDRLSNWMRESNWHTWREKHP